MLKNGKVLVAFVLLGLIAAIATSLAFPSAAHAERYLDDVFGFDRETYLASIDANWDSGGHYHGTAYEGWYVTPTPDWNNGMWWPQGNPSPTGHVGMNCGGFVGRTLVDVFYSKGQSPDDNGFMWEWWSGAPNAVDGRGAAWGGYANARSFYRTAMEYGDLVYYTYSSKADLIADHKAEKGDIIVMIDDEDGGGVDDWGNWQPHANDSHIGVFYGTDEKYDLFRHSSHGIGISDETGQWLYAADGCYESSVQPKCWGSTFYLFKFKDKGQAHVVKEDSETVSPQGDAELAGAEFSISNSNDSTTVTIQKNDSGVYEATSSPIRSGSYTVTETKTPTGYKKAADATVNVPAGGIGEVTIKDDIIRGGVEVIKVDETTGKSLPQGDGTLQGVKYEIVNNSTNKVRVGGTDYAPGSVCATIQTVWDSARNAYIAKTAADALPYGHYTITEKSTPDGYSNAGWSKTFSIGYQRQGVDNWARGADGIVKFDAQDSKAGNGWNKNVVWRGDIELIKYDDQLKRSETQGDADFEDIQFDIINRSKYAVVSPEDGTTKIAPGEVVCRITTKYVDGVYKASTAATGVNQKKSGSGTWNTPSDWNGALAYGQYEIVEVAGNATDKTIPTGYLYGSWTGNQQLIWHGMAVKNNAYEQAWLGQHGGNGAAFFSDSAPTWVNADKALVKFDDKDHGPNNTVQRGDIELIKADDNWNDSKLQGDADLAGAVFEIHNASKGVVVSPQTGQEVQPGGLVCTIKSFKDTDGKYKATTYCPAGSLAATANGWSIPANYAYLEGNCGHALPYGQYVVTEKTPPNGYMLNSEWIGRAINNDNIHTDINFSVSNGNSFALAGKNSNASATPTWVNAQAALIKFDNKKENEGKASQEHYHNGDAVPQAGASLDTVERMDETWCEDTIFRGGIRIGKVDRQNADYKPQGGATLETAIITVSSLCNNPIWTLKGTYANGQTPTWGEVAAWNVKASKAIATPNKDGVDFLNIVVHKVTKTDGTVQYYASTRDDKGVAGVDFDDGALDITLPYGRYMLREISVDSPDHIYDALTNINNGYMFDTISQNWRRQFSIGYETNTKHPALTYYNETGSFSTLVQGDAIANPTAIRVTPTDTIVYDPADNHPAGSQTVNSKHGSILDMTATNDAIPNLVARFDIHFIKKDPDGKLLAGAVFAITSKTSGETHIAVTDENGKFDSFPGSNQLTWHTKKSELGTVNGNDEGILTKKSDAGITYLDKLAEGDSGAFDYTSGVAYTTDEADRSIVDSSNSKVGNGIWFYGRTDKKTYDAATATGDGSGGATGNVNQDTRQYISSVRPDDIQTVRNDMGAFPYDDYIIQELPTANTADYKMVSFEVHMVQATKDAPSDGFKNRTEMELKSPDPILATTYPEYYARERVDAGTTVDNDLPEIHTTLVNEADTPIAAATENYTLIDKVEWYNLQNGQSYTLKGELWMKDANDQLIGDAPIATGETTFTAQGRNGMTAMNFENLDLTKLGGASLVAFETLYSANGGTENALAEHKDATDEGQTVTIPEIRTTLTDADGDKEVSAYKEIKLIDHVAYKGLKPGQTYTFTGTLHLQEVDAEGNIIDGGVVTDASGTPITAIKDELVNSRDGSVDIEFTFTAPDLQGKKVVAFEECKVLDQLYAVHADITDVPQTVYFPEIQTTALDGVTGDHIGLGENEVTLEDVVAYKNLIKGKTYTIEGTLMDQVTGEAIKDASGANLTGSYTFVAGEDENATAEQFDEEITLVSGTVKVPFTMQGDDIRGKAIVVFERLYNAPDTPEEITPEGEHEIEISKTDVATSEELPGATLIVTDSTGETVAQWVSTDESKKIKLDEGTYTLTEVTAPNGYAVAESIEFKVDAEGLVDGEKIEMKDAPTDKPEAVAIHEDINDSNQQVNYPELGTRALINDDETFAASQAEGKDIAVVDDVVSYTNLIPGREYVIEGVIMDKMTGQPAVQGNGQEIHSQVMFTPETASGEVLVKFVFEADIFTDLHHDLVVFENGYMIKEGVEGNLVHIGKHENIEDQNQTVPWEDLPDDYPKVPIQSTGDDMPLMPLLITIGVAFGAGMAFGLRRRFMK